MIMMGMAYMCDTASSSTLQQQWQHFAAAAVAAETCVCACREQPIPCAYYMQPPASVVCVGKRPAGVFEWVDIYAGTQHIMLCVVSRQT